MIWTIIIVIAVYSIGSFIFSLSKDDHELENQSLEEKFGIIVHSINDAAYNGQGHVAKLNKRAFNLYKDGENQIILFRYSTGHLTIMWKYKYFQKEVIHERQFNNVRNLSIFEQQKIADRMISEMINVVEKHKIDVLNSGF